MRNQTHIQPLAAVPGRSATPESVPPAAKVIPARPPARADRANARDADLLASVLRQTGAAPVIRQAGPPEKPTEAIAWTLPGFERRCRVATSFGDLPIQALRLRDRVRTRSGAFKAVQWIDEIRLDADFLSRHPEAHPIHLRARALTAGQPLRNMLISPAQVVCTEGLIGARRTGPATDFEGHPSICRAPQAEITYYRFHCGEPVTVSIDGAWFYVSP